MSAIPFPIDVLMELIVLSFCCTHGSHSDECCFSAHDKCRRANVHTYEYNVYENSLDEQYWKL